MGSVPVLDLDMLIAFTNRADRHHRVADALFLLIKVGRLRDVFLPASVLMEYEIVHRARGVDEEQIAREISLFQRFPNLRHHPLSAQTILKAIELRRRFGLNYFDSLHAASAFEVDCRIISTDTAFDSVEGLTRIDPYKLVSSACPH